MQRDCVLALAVGAVAGRKVGRWAGASAGRARCGQPERPVGVAGDGHARGGEGGRHVVLARVALGLLVQPVQVGVRARRGHAVRMPARTRHVHGVQAHPALEVDPDGRVGRRARLRRVQQDGVARRHARALRPRLLERHLRWGRHVVPVRQPSRLVAPLAHGALRRLVLLEPEAVLVVVAQQLGPDRLIRIQQDPAVRAAAQPARIADRVARGVALLEQVAKRVVPAVGVVLGGQTLLNEVGALLTARLAEVAACAIVAHAGGRAARLHQSERGVPVGNVLGK
eukprot:scaffold5110_cov122-Isochrysis_galbana.AAC.1